MNQAIAAQDHVGARQPVFADVDIQECPSRRCVKYAVALNQVSHDIYANVFDIPKRRMLHPIEVATRGVKERFCAEFS